METISGIKDNLCPLKDAIVSLTLYPIYDHEPLITYSCPVSHPLAIRAEDETNYTKLGTYR